ncbi:MAG: TAXI family TRAP transporter solute-binding subunit, partial [Usitatibacter sp.]
MSKSISAIAAALLLTSCAGTPPMSTTPLTVSLATATPGGGFPVYGAAFAAAIRQADPTLTIETRNTKGSAENVPLLEQGKVDLGLVQGEAAYEALAGINRSGPANMKILWAMYSSPGMFVVRSDSTARKIEDLKGKSVAWGAQGSGLVLLGGYVVDGLGMNRDRDFKAIYLEKAGDGPAMVQDGRAAALWGGGIGWPGFTTMANSAAGARFIAPSNAQIDTILKKHSFMRRVTIPAGAYKGIEQDLPSVGSWSFVFARTDLPEETAYRVARALHKAQGELG